MQPVDNTQTSFSLNALFKTSINKPWKVVAFAIGGVAFLALWAYTGSVISISATFAISLGVSSVGYLIFRNCIQQNKVLCSGTEISEGQIHSILMSELG